MTDTTPTDEPHRTPRRRRTPADVPTAQRRRAGRAAEPPAPVPFWHRPYVERYLVAARPADRRRDRLRRRLRPQHLAAVPVGARPHPGDRRFGHHRARSCSAPRSVVGRDRLRRSAIIARSRAVLHPRDHVGRLARARQLAARRSGSDARCPPTLEDEPDDQGHRRARRQLKFAPDEPHGEDRVSR